MQLNVSGHHVEVTPAMRGYVESKIERLERHFDIVSDVHCILTVEKLRHKAEAKVNVNGGTIYADNTEGDMYAAIDGLVDKLDRRPGAYATVCRRRPAAAAAMRRASRARRSSRRGCRRAPSGLAARTCGPAR